MVAPFRANGEILAHVRVEAPLIKARLQIDCRSKISFVKDGLEGTCESKTRIRRLVTHDIRRQSIMDKAPASFHVLLNIEHIPCRQCRIHSAQQCLRPSRCQVREWRSNRRSGPLTPFPGSIKYRSWSLVVVVRLKDNVLICFTEKMIEMIVTVVVVCVRGHQGRLARVVDDETTGTS